MRVADVTILVAREHQAVAGFGVLVDRADGGHAPGQAEPAEIVDIFRDEHAAAGEVLVLAQFPLAGEDGNRPRTVIETEVMQRRKRVEHIADLAIVVLLAEQRDRSRIVVHAIPLRERGRRGHQGGHCEGGDSAQGQAAHADSFRPLHPQNDTGDMNAAQH